MTDSQWNAGEHGGSAPHDGASAQGSGGASQVSGGQGGAGQSQYGQSQYGQGQQGQFSQGQNQYGQAPQGQYGQAPQNQYSQAPQGQYGQPAAQNQYGQPGQHDSAQNGFQNNGFQNSGMNNGAGQSAPWGQQGQSSFGGGAGVAMPQLRRPDGSINLPVAALFASLASQLLVLIGSLGPWASGFGMSVSGMSGDGKITFILALIAIGLLIAIALRKLPKVATWGVVAASAINLIVGLVDINDYMAWGLIFVILFGFVALGAAVAAALLPDGPKNDTNNTGSSQGFSTHV